MNGAEMVAEVFRLSRLLDDALAYMSKQVKAYCDAESAYRMAKSQAWVRVRVELPSGVAAERGAWVDAETAELRKRRDIADGMRQVGVEAIRSRRQQLSALQSLLARDRAEAELARTGPEMAG